MAQFETDEEKKVAYEFVCNRLVFIPNTEMNHLVSIAFPDFIRPLIIRYTAARTTQSERFVRAISCNQHFRVLLRQCLFLGLSDGAHIDLFRRSNPNEISHEQIFQTYEIVKERAQDVSSVLHSDLRTLLNRELEEGEKRFQMVFLLDDFSASGISYFREESGTMHGKIYKVLNRAHTHGTAINELVSRDGVHFCVVLYVATTYALTSIQQKIGKWLKEKGSKNQCSVLAVQTIPDETRLSPGKDNEFIQLCKTYFDQSIVDEHYKKGRCDEPHLGFDQCSLPLVLGHNTPNNSVPLLWSEGRYRALFPRVSRHKKGE